MDMPSRETISSLKYLSPIYLRATLKEKNKIKILPREQILFFKISPGLGRDWDTKIASYFLWKKGFNLKKIAAKIYMRVY